VGVVTQDLAADVIATRVRRQSDIDRARGPSTVSDPAPINAVDISGYILLGTKRLNIHITLEDTDAADETELEPDDRDRADAEFGDEDEEDADFEEDAEDDEAEFEDEDDAEVDDAEVDDTDEEDTDEDGEFDEEDEEDDGGFEDEDDTEDVDRDDGAPAQASLRDLLRPRPRRPEARSGQPRGGREGAARPRR
jgi:hypothetical protein